MATPGPDAPPSVIHVPQGAGHSWWVYGDEDTFKIVSDETGGALTIMETTVPPGGGTPLHIHHRESEGIYVLDGELEIVDNGLTIPIRTGSFVFMPEGSIHSFTNTREEDTSKVLILFIPGGFEQCLIEMGTPVVAGQPPPPSRSDEDIAKAKRIGPKYGLEIVDPGPSTEGGTPA
jgi:quercetin dioxygenase-like cupin family protein